MTRGVRHEAACLIVAVLADGSRHGHGIITAVRQISGGRVRLRAGTLYTVLDRLRADGLIGVDREETADSRLRRYYRLSLAGSRPQAEVNHRAAGPDLRVSDAERDAAVVALCEHFAQGRLAAEELNGRLDAALAATTRGEVFLAIWDLP
jgi:DNA-binding PadR family transcriptional regulator